MTARETRQKYSIAFKLYEMEQNTDIKRNASSIVDTVHLYLDLTLGGHLEAHAQV
jgi:hypothetical protein